MNYQTTTVNWDTIRSITHPKVAQKIADNVTNRIPLIHALNKIGNKEYEYGGVNYVLPVFKEGQTVQAYTGTTPLTSPENDPFTSAIYERKQLTCPIVASGTNMLKNSGQSPEAVVNFLTSIVEVSEQSMVNDLGGASIGILSSLTESDVGVTGLQTFLTSSQNTGVVGGLSRATYSWWRHQLDSVTTGFNTDGLVSMAQLFYACSRGDECPGIIVMTRSTYANFDRAVSGTYTYNNPTPKSQFMDVSAENLYYHGATVIFDDGIPDNTAYFLNLKYFKLLVHADRDCSIRDWIAPSDADSILARIYWAGNLVCNNLARQGILTGLPDTWA